MLKHVVAFASALIATLAGVAAWSFFSILHPLAGFEYGPLSLRFDGPPLLLVSVILTITIVLFRQRRSLPVVLAFVGAIALFIARLHDIIVGLALDFDWAVAHRFLFGFGCLEDSRIATPADVLRLMGLLIPIGFLCYASSAIQKYLTTRCSAPLAAEVP